MLARGDQFSIFDEDTARGWRWPWFNLARQRDNERAKAEFVKELRWQWRSACTGTSLAQVVYTPSGTTRGVPPVEHVDIGPPVALTVRLRPGQILADFVTAAPRIAPSLNATALQVTPLGQHWVRIVLVTAPLVAVLDTPSESNVEALKFGA